MLQRNLSQAMRYSMQSVPIGSASIILLSVLDMHGRAGNVLAESRIHGTQCSRHQCHLRHPRYCRASSCTLNDFSFLFSRLLLRGPFSAKQSCSLILMQREYRLRSHFHFSRVCAFRMSASSTGLRRSHTRTVSSYEPEILIEECV